MATADPIVIPPVQLNGYEPAVLEPFTGTRYRSVFPKAQRKYNAAGIDPDVCDQGHFTIRLIDFGNRTDDSTIVWGAVIGIKESFTFAELFLFPIFILRNHGSEWTAMSWTIWATVLVFAPLLLGLVRETLRYCGVHVLESRPFTMERVDGQRMPIVYWRPENPRVPLYELAVFAFVVTMLEEFIHLNIAAQDTDAAEYGYWIGLFVVILFANGLPLWQVLTCWAAIEYQKTEPDAGFLGTCRHRYWQCSASPLWAPFEIVFGFSYFLLFGSGFFIGPLAIMAAGFARLSELRGRGMFRLPRPLYKLTIEKITPPLSDLP